MDEELSFSELLKAVRKKKRLKITDTAKLLGVSERTYKGWEMGERLPAQTYLKTIAKTLQLDEADETTLYRAAGQVPQTKNNLLRRNTFFTGRETYLEHLEQLLNERGSVAITQPISISGLGGIGKTQLALEYAHRHYPKTYRTVLWVNAAEKATIEVSYRKLAQVLDLPEKDEQEIDSIVQAVRQWLEAHTNWLLIMDNADDLYLARSFFPAVYNGHIMLTTRSQIGGTAIASQIELEDMTPEEGLLFLLKRAKVLENEAALDAVPADIREAAQQLVGLLGCHPLALDQAGAYVEETGVSFAEYIELYKEKRKDLLKRRDASNSPYGDHPESVAVTFELSLKKAVEHHQLAVNIIVCPCAFLQPDAIKEEFFQNATMFSSDPTAFSEGIAALRRYSLIKWNGQEKELSMHRLVQAVLIDMMSPELKKHWQLNTMHLLYAALPYEEPHNYMNDLDEEYEDEEATNYWNTRQAQWKHTIFLDRRPGEWLRPHILAFVPGVDPALLPPEDVSRFLNKAAIYLDRMARTSEAEILLARAIAIQERHLGHRHMNNAVSLYCLAEIYYARKKYKDIDIEPLYRRAIDIYAQYMGGMNPFIDYACDQLIEVMMDKGVDRSNRLLRYDLMFDAENGRIADGLPPLIDNKLRTYYVELLRKAGYEADAASLEANGGTKPPK